MLRDCGYGFVARGSGTDDRQAALRDQIVGRPAERTENLQRPLGVFRNAEDYAMIPAAKSELQKPERLLELGVTVVEVRNMVTGEDRFVGDAEVNGRAAFSILVHPRSRFLDNDFSHVCSSVYTDWCTSARSPACSAGASSALKKIPPMRALIIGSRRLVSATSPPASASPKCEDETHAVRPRQLERHE